MAKKGDSVMKSGTGWMYELEVKNHVFDLIGNVGHIGRTGQMVVITLFDNID